MLYPNRVVESQPSSSNNAASRFLLPALFVVLVAVVYADPLFTGRNFSGRDLLPYGLPMEKVAHDAWARGRIPVWAVEPSGGRPHLPNPNTGTLYPVRPLLSLVSFPAAMRIFPIVHWAGAGVGMLLLLAALGASPAAAWVGAVTYVFSGVSVSQVFYQPFGPAVAFHPWLLWALVLPGTWRRKAVRLGVVWGLFLLLGDVFAIAIALLAAALWIVLGVARGQRRREAGALAAGLLLASLLAAPQIVATALMIPETQRAVTAIRLREALAFTLTPWRLLELVVPYPFGDVWTFDDHRVWGRGVFHFFYQTTYCGAFALVGLAAVARARDGAAKFCLSLFGIGVFLAGVFSFVPTAWGNRPTPVPLRYPEKFTVAMTLALAIAAGLGFDRVRASPHRRRWILGVAAALAFASLGAALFPGRAAEIAVAAVGATPAVLGEAAEELPAALAEGGLLWLATFVAVDLLRAPGRARLPAALALLTAVPIVASRRGAPAEHPAALFAETGFARAVARRDPEGLYRTIDEALYRAPSALQLEGNRASPNGSELTRRRWGYHTPVLWGRGTVFNVDVDRGDLSRIDSLRQIFVFAAGQPDADRLMSALSLRFGVRFRDQEPLAGFRKFGGDAFMDWDENPGALPDIRLASSWSEETDALSALGVLPRLPADALVLETGRRASGSARAGTVRIVERSPERLRLEVSAPDPTWLFVLRNYWSHRSIRIDGKTVEGVPAELAFTAVAVPAGEHRIDWREEFPGLAVSAWGPVLFLAFAVALPRTGGARA